MMRDVLAKVTGNSNTVILATLAWAAGVSLARSKSGFGQNAQAGTQIRKLRKWLSAFSGCTRV